MQFTRWTAVLRFFRFSVSIALTRGWMFFCPTGTRDTRIGRGPQDECLRLRTTGSLQAEQSCVLCGTRTRLYPLGLSFGPACEKCCHDNNIDATTLFGTDMWGIPDNSPWHPIAGKLRGEFSVPEASPNRETSLPPCVACGLGDNTTQHWARFCIIPVLVAATLASSPQHVRSLDQIARSSVAGCVIASHVLHQFRRLLLEHGGMQHSTSSVTLNITEWLTRLYDNCLQAIPTRFLDAQQSPIRPKNVGSTDNDVYLILCAQPLQS